MNRKPYLLISLLFVLVFSLGPERSSLAQPALSGTAGPTAVEAAITPLMSYQGRLVEGGMPVTGTRSMTFSLYNASSAGTLIWSEAQSVNVTNGLFQVALGSVTPFNETVLGQMSQNLWLEINVAGNILPRQQLMGSPYALTLAPGATVTGSTARTLSLGNLATGAGLWSHAETSHGVIASGNGSGLDGSALLAQAYSKDGIAAWALASSTDASLVVSNNGDGALVKGFGADGGEHEFMITNDGTFQQELEASGLVKAAVMAMCADDTSATVIRSFNNVGGVITVSPYMLAGSCLIDFGFPVNDRYFIATAPLSETDSGVSSVGCFIGDGIDLPTSTLLCLRQVSPTSYNDGYIMVVVY